RLISAVSALETAIVLEYRKGAEGVSVLDELLVAARFGIVSLDEAQYLLAREAYSRFGKGRHPAGLNFCDC
ncbi:MAG: type II toxin-antitoxin system VapC family toxin, partial [Nitrospiraceae bacterium]